MTRTVTLRDTPTADRYSKAVRDAAEEMHALLVDLCHAGVFDLNDSYSRRARALLAKIERA